MHASVAIAEPVSDRIIVTIRGQGPDVVLIPGLATSGAVWDATVAHLQEHYCLHIVQIAGFAGLPPQANARGPVIQPTIDALDAYIKSNKLKSPDIIGHSLGGSMALLLTIQHPEDVGKLMIVDALPFAGAMLGVDDAAAAAAQAAPARDRIIAETQLQYASEESNILRSLVKSPEGLREATGWAVTSDKSVVARIFYEDMTLDIRPMLHQIKTSVTVLYAWNSSTGISRTNTEAFYQQSFASLMNKTVVCMAESYHYIMLDQPDLFIAQVDKFLK